MNVLITGATGFIGYYIVRKFSQANYNLTALVRKSSNRTRLESAGVQIAEGDFFAPDSLKKAVAHQDLIIHNAGQVAAVSRHEFYHNNVEATRNLLDAIQQVNPTLKRFIYISSQTAVGPTPTAHPIDETYQPKPELPYGISKYQAEQVVLEYQNGFPVTILRPCSVYGPWDTAFLKLFKVAQQGWYLVMGKGTQRLNFIHAEDLAEAIFLCKDDPERAGTYFITGKGEYDWMDILRILESVLQRRLRKIYLPFFLGSLAGNILSVISTITRKPNVLNRDKTKEMRAAFWTVSAQKFYQTFPFSPKYTLEEGFKQTYDWYRTNKWIQ